MRFLYEESDLLRPTISKVMRRTWAEFPNPWQGVLHFSGTRSALGFGIRIAKVKNLLGKKRPAKEAQKAMEKSAVGLLEKTTAMGARRRSLRGENAVDATEIKELKYPYEIYDRVDFQPVNVGQTLTFDPSTATSVFLGVGAEVPGFKALFDSVSLEHRF